MSPCGGTGAFKRGQKGQVTWHGLTAQGKKEGRTTRKGDQEGQDMGRQDLGGLVQ